ncbi:MAG: hypothetical protein AAB409_01395 [Gemmatimonadota bacterium]
MAAAVENFARVLAEGLGEASVRAALHKALRESPLYSYKIVLSDFANTPEGDHLLSAIVSRAGVSVADLAHLMASLPPIQVYVPYPPHRQSWRASDPIAVAAIVDDVSPMVAHLSGGTQIPFDRWAMTLNTPVPVLLLGPHETFLTRPDAGRPRTRTDVIEEQVGGPALQVCWEDCGGGGGGGGGGPPPPSPGVWVAWLQNNGVCDHICLFDTAEFEFKGLYPPSPIGTVFYTPTVRCEGVGLYDLVNVPAMCLGNNGRVSDSSPFNLFYGGIEVYVQETDGFFGGGDDQYRDMLTSRPGTLASPIWVTGSQATFALWQSPDDLWCAPNTRDPVYVPIPCSQRLTVTLTWN